ncbi:MAG: VCBS repeat-containing protein [Chromatiales bacterium]|nr:VCBS repeat-containing protein [Chromatiales bacterium]
MQHPVAIVPPPASHRWTAIARRLVAGSASGIPGLVLVALAWTTGAGATAVGRLAAEFGVDPAGAATYVVPVSVAAGRGGLRPNIGLRYASHDGDGFAGVGFTVTGLSRITRCPLTIAVDGRVQGVRFAAGDRFCLDGQPLVLVAGTYGADGAEYRTEINNLKRVYSRGRQGSGPASFEVQHPDGLTWRYGNDADSRLEAVGTAGEVREWAINQVSDKFSNQIAYTWLDDQVTGEALPGEIRWTGDTSGSGARFRLLFGYEARPAHDQRQLHRWGASWQRLQRLTSIRYEFDGGTGFSLVHRYALTYTTGNGAGSGRSQLAGIEQCGPTECLPPTVFGWQTGVTGFEPAVAGPTDPLAGDAVFADHDGDGDADLYVPVSVGGTVRWHVRLANGATPGVYAGNPVNTGVARHGTGHALEFDGDGRRDLLAPGPGSPATWFVHRSTGTGGFLAAVNTGLTTATVPAPLVADVDGDGLDDLVYAREYIVRIRRNTGAGFGPELTTSVGTTVNGGATLLPLLTGAGGAPDFDGDGRQDLLIMRGTMSLTGPPWYYEGFLSTGADFQSLFTTPAAFDVVALDFSGDGLTDIAYRDRALGWQTRRSLGNALAPPEATGIATPIGQIVRAVDLDGDGRDDLVRHLAGNSWRAHLASGPGTGPAFSNSDSTRYFDITGGPAPDVTLRLAPVDVTGDGLPDLVFTESTGRWQVRRHRGPRPDLLASATDGLGNVFQPAYQTLGTFAGYTRNGTTVAGDYLLRGGPLPVVAAYTANDGIGGTYTTTYAYWNGRVNRLGRGFLGFEKVRATDSRYAALHGVAVHNEVTFRQDFPFIGSPELFTLQRSDGRKLSERKPAWSSRTQASAAADAAGDHHFPYLQAETLEEFEADPDGGGLGQLARSTRRTLTWDFNHGAPVREATTVSSPASSTVFNTTVTNVYDETARTAQYCLGLPLRVDTTRDMSGAGASTRSTRYTWSAATCRQLTETSGLPGPLSSQLVSTRTWNGAGQLTELNRSPADLSAPARRTAWTYNAWSDRPVTETAHITGQATPVVTSEWNHGLDVETARTSPRGLVTRWSWDEFARVRQETRADGPGTTWSYSPCSGGCFSNRGEYQLRATRSDGHVSTTVHDRYGRTVGHEASLVGGQTSRQLTEYDALGRVARQTVPYVSGEAQYWVENRHDLRGERRAEDRPADEGGGSASTRWNSNVLTRTVRDAENRISTRTLDAEGRLVAVTSATGGTASYTWTAFGELATVTDPNGTRTTLSYDERGLPVAVDSPDSGRRTSDYNAFGELVAQRDAGTPASVIGFSYDQLGRLVRRDDAGKGTTTWEFHQGPGPLLGLPSRVTGPVGTNPAGFTEQYAYDPLGRRTAVTTTVDGTAHVTNYGWDAQGRVTTMIYPATVNGARLYLGFRYDAGHLDTVEQDVLAGGGMWLRVYDVRGQDALGRERLVSLGSYSTIDEQRDYDRASTLIKGIRTGPNLGSQRQNYAYAWDKVGNLRHRQDLSQGLTEEFSYDEQNRLESARLNGTLTLALSYDAGGRIRSKSDVGTYSYGSSRPGAVTAVAGGPAGSRSYAYDANGNMTARAGKPITWHPFPLPKRIDYGMGDYAEFDYGPDRQRIRQVAKTGSSSVTTWYIGPHFEVEVSGTQRRYRSTVFANGEAVYSQVEQTSPSAFDAYFLHRDHQGSVDVLSRVIGGGSQTLAQRFDAFGKRRNANWTADPTDLLAAERHFTERGYTGHEHLDNVRLIHMNGRLQDPVLGAMLAPDPVLGNLLNPQSLNRYAYVAGNPTSLVDPSGFLFGRIGKFFKRLISGIGSLVRRVVENYGREILAAAAGFYTGGVASEWYLASVPAATAVGAGTVGAIGGGAVAGGIATGDLRGAAIGAVGGAGFGAVGAAYGNTWSFGRIAASGLAGGAAAKVGGGEFREGFAYSGGAAAFGYAYDRVVNYSATWASGGAAQGKQRYDMPIEGANNFAESRRVIDPGTFTGEGGRLSRVMNRVPGMNAIAGLHDVFQVRLDQLGGDRFGSVLRTSLNFPGMPVAAGLTYPALFDGAPSVALAMDE